LSVKLDLDMHDEIVPQDVISITKHRRSANLNASVCQDGSAVDLTLRAISLCLENLIRTAVPKIKTVLAWIT
jgi:hypothetical protein